MLIINTYHKMFSFLEMKDIYKSRQTQLVRQTNIDNNLRIAPCVEVVNAYLLAQRELNRHLTSQYDSTPVYKIPSLAKVHLETSEKEIERVELHIRTGQLCSELNK